MKLCKICNTEKPISEFYKNATKKDGLQHRCKLCSNATNNAWYAANPERHAANGRAWASENQERRRSITSDWRKANPERVEAAYKKWRDANPEKISAIGKAYRAANPEKMAAKYRRRRASKVNAEGFHTAQDVRLIFCRQRGMCANCNKKLFKSGEKKFHVDHINPLAKGGSDWPSNLQCLCPSCNLRKSAKDPLDWAKENGKLL